MHPPYNSPRRHLSPDLIATRQLVVRNDSLTIGILRETRSKAPSYSFAYAPEWLGSSKTFPISTTMALRGEPYDDPTCRPFFANLLPEGELRTAVARKLGVSPDDEFGILAEIGGDCAGALSLQPEADTNKRVEAPSYRSLTEKEIAEKLKELPERPLLVGEDGVRLSLAGVQDKLPVAVIDGRMALPLNGAPSTHIIKPAIRRYRESAHNEVFCLSLAGKMNLPTARSEIRIAGEIPFALIERYDRERLSSGAIGRIHQEDFCQALGLWPTQKYEAHGGPSYAECFALISRHSSARAQDRLTFLDAVIFNLLIGNVDAHAKNFSFILRAGSVRLAPFYDLMCATVYDGITRNMAMTIGGKNRADYICRAHWKEFARACGLSSAAVLRRIKTMAISLPGIAAAVSQEMSVSGHDAAILGDIVDSIRQRCTRVLRNLEVDHFPDHAASEP